MAKKKNYVTRDNDGIIAIWQGLEFQPVKEKGVWKKSLSEGSIERGINIRTISKELYKEFIGNLPRKGTCREFKRGEK